MEQSSASTTVTVWDARKVLEDTMSYYGKKTQISRLRALCQESSHDVLVARALLDPGATLQRALR